MLEFSPKSVFVATKLIDLDAVERWFMSRKTCVISGAASSDVCDVHASVVCDVCAEPDIADDCAEAVVR
jgi:hypothetical protein